MMRRRQGQLEPPADGGATQGYGNTSTQAGNNHNVRHDPPDHRQSDPSAVEESHSGSVRDIGRDPSVVDQVTRPKQNRNSSWSAAAMRTAMRLSQESYHRARDPSVANEPVITINRSTSRDPPQDAEEAKIQLSNRQKDIFLRKQDNKRSSAAQNGSDRSITLAPAGSRSSTGGSSSSGSPNSQQRAFLRNFLRKQGEKSNKPVKSMATAKQKLLRNVLQKSQGGAIKSSASADEAQIFYTDSFSPNNGSLREKWKRVAAANTSRMGKRVNSDPSTKEHEVEHQRQPQTKAVSMIDSEVYSGGKLETSEKSRETNTQSLSVSKGKGLSIRQRYEETLRGKTFQKPVGDEPKDADSEMEKEYRSFLDILHQEVSGQHAQVRLIIIYDDSSRHKHNVSTFPFL